MKNFCIILVLILVVIGCTMLLCVGCNSTAKDISTNSPSQDSNVSTIVATEGMFVESTPSFLSASDESASSYKIVNSFEYQNKYYYCLKVGTLKNIIVDENPHSITYNGNVGIQRRMTKSKITSNSLQTKTTSIKERLQYDHHLKGINYNASAEVGVYQAVTVGVSQGYGAEFYQNSTTSSKATESVVASEIVIQEEEEIIITFDSTCPKGSYRICNVTDYDVYLVVECPKNATKLSEYTTTYELRALANIHELCDYTPSLDGFGAQQYSVDFDTTELLGLPAPTRVATKEEIENPVQTIQFEANGGRFDDETISITYTILYEDALPETYWPGVNPVRNDEYIFVGWELNNKLYTKDLLTQKIITNQLNKKTERIVLKARWVSQRYTLTPINDNTLTVKHDSQNKYYTYDVKELKILCNQYDLIISAVQVSFDIQEINDGYQEMALTKSTNYTWKSNNSVAKHVWAEKDIIVKDDEITTTGKKGSKRFETRFVSLDSEASDLSGIDQIYLFLGAHGKYDDTWECSNARITFFLNKAQ